MKRVFRKQILLGHVNWSVHRKDLVCSREDLDFAVIRVVIVVPRAQDREFTRAIISKGKARSWLMSKRVVELEALAVGQRSRTSTDGAHPDEVEE